MQLSMLGSRTATIAVTFTALAFLIAVDIVWAVDKREGNTFSEVWRGWFTARAWIYYLVSFALGVLMGHWGPKP